jgi:hypothetical protein
MTSYTVLANLNSFPVAPTSTELMPVTASGADAKWKSVIDIGESTRRSDQESVYFTASDAYLSEMC